MLIAGHGALTSCLVVMVTGDIFVIRLSASLPSSHNYNEQIKKMPDWKRCPTGLQSRWLQNNLVSSREHTAPKQTTFCIKCRLPKWHPKMEGKKSLMWLFGNRSMSNRCIGRKKQGQWIEKSFVGELNNLIWHLPNSQAKFCGSSHHGSWIYKRSVGDGGQAVQGFIALKTTHQHLSF